MPRIGATELIIILIIILLLFGATRIPQLAGSIGKGMREFRKAISGAGEEPKEEAKGERKRGKAKAKAKSEKA